MNAKLLLPAILAALALGLVYALTKPAPPAVSQQTTAVMLPPVPSPAAIENLQPVSPPAQVNVLYAQPNVFDIVDGRQVGCAGPDGSTAWVLWEKDGHQPKESFSHQNECSQ